MTTLGGRSIATIPSSREQRALLLDSRGLPWVAVPGGVQAFAPSWDIRVTDGVSESASAIELAVVGPGDPLNAWTERPDATISLAAQGAAIL